MDKLQAETQQTSLASPQVLQAPSDPLHEEYLLALRSIFKMQPFRKEGTKREKAQNKTQYQRDCKGLENMAIILELLGNPHHEFKVVHVAGTNGKGSVTLKTAVGIESQKEKLAAGEDSPFRVGLFTSPHVSTFRERCSVFEEGKRVLISKEQTMAHFKTIFDVVEGNREKILAAGGDANEIRFFDLITLMAFLEFSRQKCQWVVLECGLGGRLDATNVIPPPAVVAITSIGLDHTDVLGETMPEIAEEKSKIIKGGIRGCVIGPSCYSDQAVFKPIEQQILEVGASIEKDLVKIQDEGKGVNEINSRIALSVLSKVLGEEPTDSLKELVFATRQPCRFEFIRECNPPTILDVCHNPQSFAVTFEQIARDFGSDMKIRVVMGQATNKEAVYITNLMSQFKQIQEVYLVSTPHMRLKTLGQIKDEIATLEVEPELKAKLKVVGDGASNIKETLEEVAKSQEGVVLVCGSFFIMTEVRVHYGLLENTTEFIDYI